MASYAYVAMDKSGKRKKGTMESPSAAKVENTLKADGLTVIEVKEAGLFDTEVNLNIGSVVSKRDLSVFCRQMVSLLKAGVPIIDAVDMLSQQSENKRLMKGLQDVKNEIAKGDTLANAFRTHREVFPDMIINMVEAGEASGSLEIAFERTALQFEKDAALSGAIKKAMIYPIIVVCVTIAVVIVLLVKVVPTFEDMFKQMDTELPKITIAVVGLSKFVKSYWYALLAIVAVGAIGAKLYSSSEDGKKNIDTLLLKIPFIGKLLQKATAARFARTLSTLTAAGISLIDALDITAKNMSNYNFREAVIDAKEEVAKGVPLSEPITRSKVFPIMICNMIKIGENTGDLEGMLDRSAGYFEEETEIATAQLMAMMEPMIIVVLAGLCGTIIGAVMAPMAKMYESLDNL